jgi:hypothetical protein
MPTESHFTPQGHADMPSRLDLLGSWFVRRLGRTGALTDISESVPSLQKAVHLAPQDHADTTCSSGPASERLSAAILCAGLSRPFAPS